MARGTLIVALLLAGCTPKARYQGDVVLGNFAFEAAPSSTGCQLGASPAASFSFTGVFSFDSKKQVLYLDTDDDTNDDHVGTLTGTHFRVAGSAQRDLGCGTPVIIDEVLEGDLFLQQDALDGGCSAVEVDGGPESVIGDGGVTSFQPYLGCGALTDTPRATVSDGGVVCETCALVYTLTAVRQQ